MEVYSSEKGKKNGKAKVRIIIAIKKNIEVKEFNEREEDVAEIKIKWNDRVWRIMTMCSQKTENVMEAISADKVEEGAALRGGF